MSAELLTRSDEATGSFNGELGREEAMKIGGTVFEALAIDGANAIEAPEGIEDPRFTMSVTRIPDGQTVPDER